MKVLFAPRNTSGQGTEMAAAVRGFGHQAEVWSYGEPVFGFPADRVVDADRLVADPRYLWSILAEAVERFDVFHFMYGRSLIDPVDPVLPPLWDLPLLKLLGKRVYMHFRGSDVRLPSIHKAREPASYFDVIDVEVDEHMVRERISICRRFCDGLFVSTPGLLDYVPDARLVPHTLDVSAWAAERGPEAAIPTVVHIPSHPAIKGSAAVDAALGGLAVQGIIRYERLEGVGRPEVRGALQRADMVVDSIAIGDHGLVSVEAMAAGCIAIGHIHEENRRRNPGVPVVEVDAATLGDVAASLARDPERRAALRREQVGWVETHHDREVIGEVLDALYRMPPVAPKLHRPDWPAWPSPGKVQMLEAELEQLRSAQPQGATQRRSSLGDRLRRFPRIHLLARKVRRRLPR